MYNLLIVVGVLLIITYIYQSFFADIQHNDLYPEQFLIKSKFILRYFCNPGTPITKHYTILHFISLFYFILTLVMYAIYWITGSNPILENPQFREYSIIGFSVFNALYVIICCFIERRFS